MLKYLEIQVNSKPAAKTSMPEITYRIYEDIGQIGKESWGAVFGEVPESYAFYKTLSGSNLCQFNFFYLAGYCGAELVLIAPLFSTDFNLDIAVEGKLSALIGGLRRVFPRFLITRTLFCGSPFAEFGVVGVRPGWEKSEKMLAVLEAGMEVLAEKIKARVIIFKDFPESARPFLDPLLRKGFSRIRSLPNVAVELNYKSFPEYLESLGKSTRKNLKRKLKEAQEREGLEVQVVRDISAHIEQVVELYENAYRRGGTKFERLNKEFFLCASRELAPHTLYFLYSVQGKLAAFNLCFVYNNLFIDKFIGFDYDISVRYNLYFVSWANNIRWCIDHSLGCYHPGQTDYAPKIRLGGKLVTLFVYLRHRSAILNFLLRPLIWLLKPDNFGAALK
jgi:hypothetical protein